MNRNFKVVVFAIFFAFVLAKGAYAGNPDRAGEAGAYELLIDPFARSAGLYGLNTASTQGVESMAVNPAGMAYTKKTEIVFTYNDYLAGAGININAIGIAQKFGKDKSNVVGLNLNAISFGNVERTTTAAPDPGNGLGTFSPTFINIALGYSRIFSNSITAGALVRLVDEKIDNLNATGACLDAGIQYVTGKRNEIHFGVALKNVGLPMKYTGEGLTITNNALAGTYTMSQEQRSQSFDMPSQLNIGAAYDLYFDKASANPIYRLTFNAAFIANSFGKDQYGAGLEFGYHGILMLRVAYRYEAGLTDASVRTSANTGLAAGLTVEIPFKKDRTGPALGIDYAYRTSSPFNGTHSIGVHFNL